MKIYQLPSTIFQCDVRITYNDHGTLINFEVMNPDAKPENATETSRLYVTENGFKEAVKHFGLKVIEVQREITFDMFWKRYNYPLDKQPAQKAWMKLSKDSQIRAYDYIPMYESQRKSTGSNKKYPATYLNSGIYLG